MATAAGVDCLAELCVLLQRERLLLELLVFKLTGLSHLLGSGDPRFLGWAAEEVERAVEAIRLCELDRAVHVQTTAAVLLGGPVVDEPALLVRLAAAVPEPWAGRLTAHRAALTALADEVAAGLRVTRQLADAGNGALTALLDRAGAPGEPSADLLTYGPGSGPAHAGSGSATSWTAPAPRLRTTL